MSTQNKQPSTERVELKGILSEFREALEEEIDKIKKSGQSSTLLFDGRQIESHGAELWYRFRVEYAPSLPADTPCKLVVGKDQFDVTVISFDADSIVISAKTPLPDTIGKARLENGATVLMERLIKCIEENADEENPAGNRMLPSDNGVYSAKKIFEYSDLALNKGNTQSQNSAIISALSNDITYIWGPPGTGKTTVIGQIIDELYKHSRTVLVVSHTNTAVDGAIEKAASIYSESNPDNESIYPILRLGTSARSLDKRVFLEEHVATLGKELYKQKTELEKRQKELQHRINEILPFFAKDTWLKENNLGSIRNILQGISELDKEITEITHRIEIINSSAAREKAAHPEYAHYSNLSKVLEAKKSEYFTVCCQLDSAEQAISTLPDRIQAAQDEVRKHDIFSQLKTQAAKYMSASFLRNEIVKASEQITLLQNSINSLTSQQSIAQQTITEYEKKSSVGKFFTGKSNVIQAQATLEQVRQELPVAVDDLRRQQALKQEYSQQLESLLLLQEQIRAVTPSNTPKHWNIEASKLQSELSNTQKQLADLSARKNALHEKVCELELKKAQAKVSFGVLGELGKKAHREEVSLAAAKELQEEEAKTCAKLLEKELAFCYAFNYKPSSKDPPILFGELTKLHKAIKVEMSRIDVAPLKEEAEDAKQQLIGIFRLINEIKQKLRELEKRAIMSAKIVGATLAKSYLSETLRERKFDTVILDEASMASIPALWCASYLAENNIVIVGDFLQLSPIVLADTPMAKKWLGKDIFNYSGMQEMAKKGNKDKCPENFVMLNDQFRMESDIAEIANIYYDEYSDLHSDDNNESRVEAREEFYSWYPGKRTKQNVHLIDTESLHAWVTGVPQGKSHSRLNCFSAAVSVDLAFKLLENKLKKLDPEKAKPEENASVLIIAPYKPHIERVKQLLDLEYRNRGFKENLNFIRAGTIHSFQGSEADIVIFDLVVDEPHWKANLFMTDKRDDKGDDESTGINKGLRKMFNVAVTRAKFKLFIVGNFSYCQKRTKDNALSELLDKLIKTDKLVKVDAKSILPNLVFARQSDFVLDGVSKGKHIVCREESFNDYFMADVKSFKSRLIVYSPFMTEMRLGTLMPAFTDAINAGKQIIVVTKALSDRGKSELTQYQKCEQELRNIGVSVLHKKGMHEKLIFVDSNAVWIGSLNALSFTGLTGEVMQRHEDKDLTAEYEKLFDIEHLCLAIENAYEQKCPICGSEMIVKESDEGGIYWQCVSGDYSRNAAQQYPKDGILRCKCGAPYVFAMKNEPRWVCSADSKHFQKMRESDLKLEKMAALIPSKTARKEVDRYFSAKKKEIETKKNSANTKKTTSTKKSSNASKGKDKDAQMKMF